MSKQFNVVPDKAVTIVVHPTAGVGDATTIADGIAMLPSTGGNILLREGTYSPSTTVTMPDASVRISGSGDNTLIDLGSNAIAIFTIPDGLTSTHAYTFENFRVIGNSAANQKIVDVQDTNARGKITINRVNTGNLLDTTKGVRGGVLVTSGDTNFLTPVFIEVNDSWWVPVTANSTVPPVYHASYLVSDSNGNGYIIQASFKKFNYFITLPIPGTHTFNNIGGSFSDFTFGSVDFSFYDSNLSITVATNNIAIRESSDSIGLLNAVNTAIFNWGEFGQFEIDMSPFGFVDEVCNLTDCVVHGMLLIPSSSSFNINGGQFFDTSIALNSGISAVVGASFETDNDQNTEGTMLEVKGVQTLIDGCRFFPGTSVDKAIIIDTGNANIGHCQFAAIASGGTHQAGITVGTGGGGTGSDNFIHDNYFQDTFGVPPILEQATADRNRYDNNSFGSPPTTAPVFVGVNNVFNDVTQASTSGTTTSSLAAQFTHTNPNGIIGIGTIKNTGGSFSMDVKETATDLFGVTGSHTSTVALSASYSLNPISPTVPLTTGGSPLPPFISYKVEVVDTVGGNHTTFVLHHANLGVR